MPRGYPKESKPFAFRPWPGQRMKWRIKKLEAALLAMYSHVSHCCNCLEHDVGGDDRHLWEPIIKELKRARR